jgi:hypothetical protein
MHRNGFGLEILLHGEVLAESQPPGVLYRPPYGFPYSVRLSVPSQGRFVALVQVDALDPMTGRRPDPDPAGLLMSGPENCTRMLDGYRSGDRGPVPFVFRWKPTRFEEDWLGRQSYTGSIRVAFYPETFLSRSIRHVWPPALESFLWVYSSEYT